MGIIKKVAKAAKKTVKKGAKQTYKGTAGRAIRGAQPGLKDVLGAAKKYNPYTGISEATKALKKDRSKRR